MELNTRFSGGYKRDNESIPKYLQDKPRQFLKHCLERITTAKDIRPQFIKEGEKRGEFVIQSTQTKNTRYNLSFGGTDHDGMPRCSCPDFSCTGFLCKHFFAVFEHRDDWKWDALPKSYRENPYLCLDEKGLSSNPISIDETSPDPDYRINCNSDDETTITLYAESKKRICSLTSGLLILRSMLVKNFSRNSIPLLLVFIPHRFEVTQLRQSHLNLFRL